MAQELSTTQGTKENEVIVLYKGEGIGALYQHCDASGWAYSEWDFTAHTPEFRHLNNLTYFNDFNRTFAAIRAEVTGDETGVEGTATEQEIAAACEECRAAAIKLYELWKNRKAGSRLSAGDASSLRHKVGVMAEKIGGNY